MTIAEFKRNQLENLKANKPQPHCKINNNFINKTIKKNNLMALKIMFYLATILEKQNIISEFKDEDDETLISTIIEIDKLLKCIYCDIKDIKKTNLVSMEDIRDIQTNLTSMQGTSICFFNEKEQMVNGMILLPYFKIMSGENKIEIHLFKRIAEMIIDFKKDYICINTELLMKAKSKHTLRFLPLLKQFDSYNNSAVSSKTMTLAELNEFFGTNYQTIKAVEDNILKHVKKELDEISNLSFIYEVNFDVLGVGRPKAISVTIDFKPNK